MATDLCLVGGKNASRIPSRATSTAPLPLTPDLLVGEPVETGPGVWDYSKCRNYSAETGAHNLPEEYDSVRHDRYSGFAHLRTYEEGESKYNFVVNFDKEYISFRNFQTRESSTVNAADVLGRVRGVTVDRNVRGAMYMRINFATEHHDLCHIRMWFGYGSFTDSAVQVVTDTAGGALHASSCGVRYQLGLLGPYCGGGSIPYHNNHLVPCNEDRGLATFDIHGSVDGIDCLDGGVFTGLRSRTAAMCEAAEKLKHFTIGESKDVRVGGVNTPIKTEEEICDSAFKV